MEIDLSQRPELYAALGELDSQLKAHRRLPERLAELVRLRVAYRNQCRPCMSSRSGAAIDEGLTEDLVCSLEKPYEAEGMTERERLAVVTADRFATDHLSISEAALKELSDHFDDGEIIELLMLIAMYVGFGRMTAIFDRGEDLPVGERPTDGGELTPWGIDPIIVR